MQKALTLLGIAVLSVVGFTWLTNAPASAVTPPDSCFQFSAGSIISYYGNEDNNSANPTCPRDVDIPSVINNTPVTTIHGWAFSYKNITRVSIPDSVTHIGNNTFDHNQITEVSLGSSVEFIGESAFYENKITTLAIPNSVREIERWAFGFNRIADLKFEEGVTTVGTGAFTGNLIKSVVIPDSLTSLNNTDLMVNGNPITRSIFGPQGENVYDFWQNVEIDGYLGVSDALPGNTQYIPEYDTWVRQPWLIAVYTKPTNTHTYQNFVDIGTYFDADWSPTDKHFLFGGHIINPASVILDFNDASGNALKPSQTVTGMLPDGSFLHDYSIGVSDITIPYPADTTNITAAEQAAIQTALKSYYRVGDTFTYTAPLINGIAPTPASYSFVLGASTQVNTKTFVYSATTAPVAGNGLANTGTSLTTMLIAAVSLIFASVLVGLYRYKLSRRL